MNKELLSCGVALGLGSREAETYAKILDTPWRKVQDQVRREVSILSGLPTLVLGILDNYPRTTREIIEILEQETGTRYCSEQIIGAIQQLESWVVRGRRGRRVVFSCPYDEDDEPSPEQLELWPS